MKFKEALIAHLQGDNVEAMGIEGEWKPLMQKIGEGQFSYIDHNVYMDLSFRLAPRTITVNGREVPEPVKEKPKNAYYCVCLEEDGFVVKSSWADYRVDFLRLERGLIHLTKEAAIAHAKAMLGMDE